MRHVDHLHSKVECRKPPQTVKTCKTYRCYKTPICSRTPEVSGHEVFSPLRLHPRLCCSSCRFCRHPATVRQRPKVCGKKFGFVTITITAAATPAQPREGVRAQAPTPEITIEVTRRNAHKPAPKNLALSDLVG